MLGGNNGKITQNLIFVKTFFAKTWRRFKIIFRLFNNGRSLSNNARDLLSIAESLLNKSAVIFNNDDVLLRSVPSLLNNDA